MKITTKQFGQVELNEEEIINFPEGLVGLEKSKRFVILGRAEEEPFKWLQCVDKGDLAFVVADPMLIAGDYGFDVDDDTTAKIGLERPEDTILFVIVTLKEDFRKMTANLLGPIIINGRNRKATQMILHNSDYSTKHFVFSQDTDEEKSVEKNG